MNQKLLFVALIACAGLVAYSMNQSNTIKKLRKVQKSYEEITANFGVLDQRYQETLENYESIKEALQKSNTNLDSLQQRLSAFHAENSRHLDSVNLTIVTIIDLVDTTSMVDAAPIVNLRDILHVTSR